MEFTIEYDSASVESAEAFESNVIVRDIKVFRDSSRWEWIREPEMFNEIEFLLENGFISIKHNLVTVSDKAITMVVEHFMHRRRELAQEELYIRLSRGE